MQVGMRRKTRWEEKREASLQALLDSAMRCFGERGYAATRVEDIVQGTGYTSGAFYFHFKNKADCCRQVIDYRARLRGDWPTHILDGLEPATSSLQEVLEQVFAHFAKVQLGVGDWVAVMVDFRQQYRHDPETQALLADFYARSHAEIQRFVEALQRGGWVDPGRDPDLLATQLYAFGEGVIIHGAVYGIDRTRGVIDGHIRLLTS